MNAKNVRALLQVTKNSLYKFGRATKTVGKVVIRAGRSAIYFPFNWLGNYIGRNLAMSSLFRMAASQTVQLRKLVASAGKPAGAAGLFLEAKAGGLSIAKSALRQSHKDVIDLINEEFAEAYAKTLVVMTREGLNPPDEFFEQLVSIKRIASEPPDVFGVIEHFSKTGDLKSANKNPVDWVNGQVSAGIKIKEEKVSLAEVKWQSLYRESYNLYMVFMGPSKSEKSQQTRAAFQAFGVAQQLVRTAGTVSCFHDILAFIIASSVHDAVSPGTDAWEDWKLVGAFHRSVFGEETKRKLNYRSLIDSGNLKISIPPFGDYE